MKYDNWISAQKKKVVENVVMKNKCPKCKVEFHPEDALKSHMMVSDIVENV